MKITKNKGLLSLGDSITVGQNATTGNSYFSKLGSCIGGALSNQGVSGSGTCEAARRGVTLPKTREYAVSVLSGLNDVRRYGVNAIPMIKANIRAIIHAALAGDCTSGGHVSRVGTWSVLSSTLGGRGRALPSGGAVSSTDPNALMTWTFSGTNCLVGTIATPSSTGDLLINVDGTDYELCVTGVTLESHAYPSILISGLCDEAHTLTIRHKTAGTNIVVDYVGVLRNNAPILIGEIPYLTSLTYAGNTITLADIDAVNAAIESVVNEFCDYPVAYVRTNDFYDVVTGISSDAIHPNNTGHNQIFEAFKDAFYLVEYLTIPSSATKIIINDEHEFTPPLTIEVIS